MNPDPEHKIAIVVKFLPATNSRGSRIGLSLPRWDNKAKRIPYNHECRDTESGARAWLAEKGVTPDTLLDLGTHYVLACEWVQRPAIFKAFGLKETT